MRTLWRKLLATTLLLWIIANTVNITLIANAVTWETSTWTTAICKDWINYYPEQEIVDKYIQAWGITWTCEELENIEEKIKVQEVETNTWTVEEKSKKVEICKVQPNWKEHTQEVANEAVDSILKDWRSYLWECKNETKETKPKQTENSDNNCFYVDTHWNPRQIWSKAMTSNNQQDKESVKELYKICKDWWNWNNKWLIYSPSNPHPWCKPVLKIFEKHQENWIIAPWQIKKYELCQTTWYPMPIKNNELQNSSIQINDWDEITESLSVYLTLTKDTNPEYMRFSEDENTWTDWMPYSYTTDFLISSLSGNKEKWLKTIYVQYKENWTESKIEYDQINLVNKYDAQYNITNSWLEKKQQYESWKTYKFELSVKNQGNLEWTPNGNNPIMLSYKLVDETWNEIQTATNYWILPNEVKYSETTNIKIPVRIPNNTSWSITIIFDMLHTWNGYFSEFWDETISKTIQVNNSETEKRQSLYNTESLNFGIWEYTTIENEPTPEIVTVCNESWDNLYESNQDKSVFKIKYLAPFWRSVHQPNIYDTFVNSGDNTAFYSLNYSEHISDNSTLYLYRDSTEITELCAIEKEQHSDPRECEQYYSDLQNTTNNQCLDISKANSLKWIEWDNWEFRPYDSINRAEFSKILLWASETPVMPYEWKISDIDWTEWWADYAQTVTDNNLMDLSSTWAFRPLQNLTFIESLKSSLKTFDFNINNNCNYEIIHPENSYIWAWLFFWIITKNDIPTNPELDEVDRMTVTSMMLNSYYQQNNLKNAENTCPNSVDDRFTREIQEVCNTEKQAILSITKSLNKDGIKLENWTKVEILENSSNIVKVQVQWLAEEWLWYLSSNELTETCTIPTPTEELKTPEWDEVVVASLVWIYAHEKPGATSNYFDYNKDWQTNNQDIISYNTVLTVLESKWNWFKVQFEDSRTAWIFNWFVAIWPDVILDTPKAKVTGTISWAHNLTVDLRANTNTDTKENIIWETYEDTKVQVLEKDEERNLYYIKIENTEKNLTQEIFDTHYARLYPNFTLEEVNEMQNSIAGWIHEDFVELDWVDYSEDQTLDYPFDYEALSNSWRTVDQLVTQIFFEEFNWDIHDAMDFNLEAWEEVKAVTNGTIQSAGTWTVTVLHDDWKKSTYAHIVTSEDILNWTVKTVTPEIVVWVVAPDTAEYKAHLHFELKGGNWESLNPAKYFKIYNSQDSHKCMRELVVEKAIYDGKEVAEKCDIWIWWRINYNPNQRCILNMNWNKAEELKITRTTDKETGLKTTDDIYYEADPTKIDCEKDPWDCIHYFWVIDKDPTFGKYLTLKINALTQFLNTGIKNFSNYENNDEKWYIENTKTFDSFYTNTFEFTNHIYATRTTDRESYLWIRFLKKNSPQTWYLETSRINNNISTIQHHNILFVPFLDVYNRQKSEYCESIKTARERERISWERETSWERNLTGYFYPDEPLTREAAVKIILRAAVDEWIVKMSDIEKYDVLASNLTSWAKKCLEALPDLKWRMLSKYACYAYNNGILDWNNGKFLPEDNVTHAEAQKIIWRAFQTNYPDPLTSRFTSEYLPRDMFVYFVDQTAKSPKDNREMDIEKLWSCVLHSKELDEFVVTNTAWDKEVVKFVEDDWRRSDNIDGYGNWKRNAFDEDMEGIRGRFISYVKGESNCNDIYNVSVAVNWLLEVRKSYLDTWWSFMSEFEGNKKLENLGTIKYPLSDATDRFLKFIEIWKVYETRRRYSAKVQDVLTILMPENFDTYSLENITNFSEKLFLYLSDHNIGAAYDLKRSEYFMAEWTDGNTQTNQTVLVFWKKYQTSQLWNFFVWLNGYRVWLELEQVYTLWFALEWFKYSLAILWDEFNDKVVKGKYTPDEFEKYLKDRYNRSIKMELFDQRSYIAWYNFWKEYYSLSENERKEYLSNFLENAKAE